tara:strand:+ start:7052 stop:8371 length:1320 start_codon:yes stop_codon:yes gene_type:complete
MKFLITPILLIGSIASADTLHVPGKFATIQSAIDYSLNGDQIHIAPGHYSETLDTLGKSIQLIGVNGALDTIIDAEGLGDAVIVMKNNEGVKTVITGLTLTGGAGHPHPQWGTLLGGAIFGYYVSPTITDCIIEGNEANYSAGIWLQESHSVLNNIHFENNHTNFDSNSGAGALYAWNSTLLVTNCSFVENSGVGGGGAVRCKALTSGGDSLFQNCTFTSNSTGSYGGAVTITQAHPTFEQCTFTNNTAPSFGGAVSISYNSQGTFRNCSFTGNTSGNGGGAIRILEGSLIIEKCNFSMNTAVFGGGGIALYGAESTAVCTISGSQFEGNDGGFNGGAISHVDVATSDIDSSIFCGNLPETIGGSWTDLGNNTINASCLFFCTGDINASGDVNVSDILQLIADFGDCNGIDSCFSDVNRDGLVNVSDLLLLIGDWGICN